MGGIYSNVITAPFKMLLAAADNADKFSVALKTFKAAVGIVGDATSYISNMFNTMKSLILNVTSSIGDVTKASVFGLLSKEMKDKLAGFLEMIGTGISKAMTAIQAQVDELTGKVKVAEGINAANDLLKNTNVRAMTTDELSMIIRNNPKEANEVIKIISQEFGTSIKANPLRQEYESAVSALKDLAKKLEADGISEEAIAKQLHQTRRDLGVKYKDLSPQLLKEYIYDVNITRYQDPLGPTVDYLINTKNKTWKEIIDSATRPNDDVDKLLGGFEEWLKKKSGL